MLVGPWFLNLLISVCYTSISVFLFIRTDFGFLLYYDLSTILLMLGSIGLMLEFLRKMHFGQLPLLREPMVIPHPTYVCSLVLTASVSVGYCYIFVYKLALYGCDRAVEAQDGLHMTLDSVLRFTIALYSLISFVYIIQRSHVGSVNTKFDILTRNFINCTFGIIWLRFVLLKAYFTIEQFCRDQIEMMSIVKAFCPPYIKNGFHCPTISMRTEQQIWYRLHYGLLKSVVVTAASEFVPVLLVGHWLACGRAASAVRKMTIKIDALRAIKKFSLKKLSLSTVTDEKTASSTESSRRLLLFRSPLLRSTIRTLIFCLSTFGLLLWMLSFYNFISDDETKPSVFVQDTLEVVASILQLGFFLLLFQWTRLIPTGQLDLHRRVESRGDKVLIFGSALFLSVECICEVLELLFFSFHNKRTHLAIKVLDIMYSVTSTTANWLEAFCLMKVIALKQRLLFDLASILPFIALGCTVFNFADFAMTYFYIETEKHHLKGVIESLESSEFFVLVGVTGRILDTANYLYTFTCALCWIDVLMRYYHAGFFVIGATSPSEDVDMPVPFKSREVRQKQANGEVYC